MLSSRCQDTGRIQGPIDPPFDQTQVSLNLLIVWIPKWRAQGGLDLLLSTMAHSAYLRSPRHVKLSDWLKGYWVHDLAQSRNHTRASHVGIPGSNTPSLAWFTCKFLVSRARKLIFLSPVSDHILVSHAESVWAVKDILDQNRRCIHCSVHLLIFSIQHSRHLQNFCQPLG